MGCTHDFGSGFTACHCPHCHETFSSVQAFDLHQPGGQCARPHPLRKRDGEPQFAVSKTTADGRPVWSIYRPGLSHPHASKQLVCVPVAAELVLTGMPGRVA